MKCIYCGGEVPAKSTKCPYCGRENASGIAFEQEVKEKEERNKVLPEKILKKNASLLTQKILTRVIIVSAVLNVLLLLLTFFMFLWSERDYAESTPAAGSHAERFLAEYDQWDNYYIKRFTENLDSFLDAKMSGEEVNREDIEVLTDAAYDLAGMITEGKIEKEEADYAENMLNVFFEGYMDLPKEMQIFYHSGERKNYTADELQDVRKQAVDYICKKEGIA